MLVCYRTAPNGTGTQVDIHGKIVVGPVQSVTSAVARALAAQQALPILQDPHSDMSLNAMCTCDIDQENRSVIMEGLADMDLADDDHGEDMGF